MKRKHAGFTLTELVTAVAISAILLLIAGMLLVPAISSWTRGQRKINLDSDAAYAVLMMEKHLREGFDSEITDDGRRIDIFDAEEEEPFRSFFFSDNSLITEEFFINPRVVLRNVDELYFSTTTVPSEIKIELFLEEKDPEEESVYDIQYRAFLPSNIVYRIQY